MQIVFLKLVKYLMLAPMLCALFAVAFYGCTEQKDKGIVDVKRDVFVDITESAGLNFNKDSYAHCWGDINGDGLPDIFVINHIESPSLFKNNGDGTFIDITVVSGIKRGGDHHGCAIVDYDNDGDHDIYVTVGAQRGKGRGHNRLYQNDGNGKFIDVALREGVSDPAGRGRSASWVDYDRDGYLDLFIANRQRNDAPSVLYKNNGDGRFIDVSVESGLNIVDTLSEASWVDYDKDGYMDLTTVSSRKHRKWEINIYRNLKNGTFEKTESFAGWTYAWGDYDNDSDLDLFVSTPPRVYFYKYELSILSKIFKGSNKLYENRGNGQFVDVSEKAHIDKEMGGDKAVFFDYDNDGDLDLYLLISGTIDENINDIFFENNGDGTFVNATEKIGLVQDFGGRGSGVAYSDYNNDGFLDLFLTNGRGPYKDTYEIGRDAGPYILYKNKGNGNHWITIKLVGVKSNRDGIGTHVKVFQGNKIQYRQNRGGMEGYVQNSNKVHFGLGDADIVDKLEIRWPNGSVTSMTDIHADQVLTVKEH